MKKVLMGGLLGACVLVVWLIVVDGILGFKSRIEMKQLPNERIVYEFLREHVTEPGNFVCNPEVTPDQRFPGDAPIFGVHYTGLGHDDAGREIIVGLVVMLLAPVLGAWLLSNASSRVLSRYGSRATFFAAIGMIVALFGMLGRFGLASFSLGDALALGMHDFAAWVLVGFVVAWKVAPDRERETQ